MKKPKINNASLEQLQNGSVYAILTDPPYGLHSQRPGHTKGPTTAKEFIMFLADEDVKQSNQVGEGRSLTRFVYLRKERNVTMKTWIIDLGSFSVEAETEEQAVEVALKQIERGEVQIDQVLPCDDEDEESEDDG